MKKLINQAVEAVKLQVPLFMGMVENRLPIRILWVWRVHKELNVTGISGRRMYGDLDRSHEYTENRQNSPEFVVGKRMKLEEFEKAIELLPLGFRKNCVPGSGRGMKTGNEADYEYRDKKKETMDGNTAAALASYAFYRGRRYLSHLPFFPWRRQ